jgi:hypothetical protein
MNDCDARVDAKVSVNATSGVLEDGASRVRTPEDVDIHGAVLTRDAGCCAQRDGYRSQCILLLISDLSVTRRRWLAIRVQARALARLAVDVAVEAWPAACTSAHGACAFVFELQPCGEYLLRRLRLIVHVCFPVTRYL